MSVVALRRRYRAGGVAGGGGYEDFSSYTLLSSLLSDYDPGEDLLVPSWMRLLINVEMQDEDRLGYVLTAPGSEVRHDPRVPTRFLAKGIVHYGHCGTAMDRSIHPTQAVTHLWGARPTTSGNDGGGPLKFGPTHADGTDASTGNNGRENDQVTALGATIFGWNRAYINMGGTQYMVGQDAPPPFRLQGYNGDGNVLEADRNVTLAAGTELWVSPNGFYSASERTEKRIVASAVTNSPFIPITVPLGFARFKGLQYLTDAIDNGNYGLSLVPGTFATYRAHAEQNNVIDQRAWVIARNRNVIVGAYDCGGVTSLANDEYGWHQMSMDIGSKTFWKNVQSNDGGQLGMLGRYGLAHLHETGYLMDKAAGDILANYYTTNPHTGLADGKFATGDCRWENCTAGDLHNRAQAIHAARGVEIVDCASLGSVGHATFAGEDGSETRNLVQGCVNLGLRVPDASVRLKDHDQFVAGLWNANPDNDIIDNWTVDSPQVGWWNAFSWGLAFNSTAAFALSSGCLGRSSKIPIRPFWWMMGNWDGNSAMSCGWTGGNMAEFPGNNRGGLVNNGRVRASFDGTDPYGAGSRPIVLKNAQIYKCNQGGYRNIAGSVLYTGWTLADNRGPCFTGSVDGGNNLRRAVAVMQSLNTIGGTNTVGTFAASYHGLLTIQDVTLHGFKGGTPSPYTYNILRKPAATEGWDLYTSGGLQLWSYYMSGWKLIDTLGFYHAPSRPLVQDTTFWDAFYATGSSGEDHVSNHGDGSPASNFRWQLSPAVYDHFGKLSEGPGHAGTPNCHIIWNIPFCTEGLTTAALSTDHGAGSVRTNTPFCGFIVRDQGSSQWDSAACTYQRLNPATGAPISGAVLSQRDRFSPGSFNPRTGATATSSEASPFFGPFNNGVCPDGGAVEFKFTGRTDAPGDVISYIWRSHPDYNPNAASGRAQVLKLPYTGTGSIVVRIGNDTATQVFTNEADVMTGAAGRYWRDTTNKTVTIKHDYPSSGTGGGQDGTPPNSTYGIRVSSHGATA